MLSTSLHRHAGLLTKVVGVVLALVKAIALLYRYARQQSAGKGRGNDLQTTSEEPCPSVDCQVS